ncbi:MAG: hypothetical protein JSS76_13865 [Bacteroidetes bacterium]|nr:hypothetical protein [Bacteroidota bacterium]MBS1685830.1 hypothetical protein [Bacteroidota bacterium]
MKIRILILSLLLTTLLTACKKETTSTGPRSTSYNFTQQNNSGITGKILFVEADSGQTTVDFELNNTPAPKYIAHIHQGPPTSYHGAIYYFYDIPAWSNMIRYKQNIPLPYDSALQLNCTLALHDSTGNMDLGIAGVGINH